jgi:glycosyltransferase involved in cell wall biosynthesis
MEAAEHAIKPLYYYVDHTSRFSHNSGIQRCVRALARALMELGQPLIPVVWNRQREQLAPATPEALDHLARWSGPAHEAWTRWADASSDPPDWLLIVELVSGPHNPSRDQLLAATRPLNLRLAWLFHDAIPVRWAQLYGAQASQAARCHATYMAALAGYTRVFCNSHTTRQHLLEFFDQQGLASNRKELEHRIRPLPLAEDFGRERGPIPPRRSNGAALQLLCVSTLEPRKNHLGLFMALAWLHSHGLRHWHLQLVGWEADGRIVGQLKRAQTAGLPIQWRGRTDDNTLELLYRQADLCVYPSLEEGFGLPVAESLWHRRPCLCSGTGALGERAAGGGCLTVNTADWRAIATGLERLMMEPDLRHRLSLEADRRRFRRWCEVAAELLAGLQDP